MQSLKKIHAWAQMKVPLWPISDRFLKQKYYCITVHNRTACVSDNRLRQTVQTGQQSLGHLELFSDYVRWPMQTESLKFGNLHVFEWDMGHWPILRAHHHFWLGLSLTMESSHKVGNQKWEVHIDSTRQGLTRPTPSRRKMQTTFSGQQILAG